MKKQVKTGNMQQDAAVQHSSQYILFNSAINFKHINIPYMSSNNKVLFPLFMQSQDWVGDS